MFNYIISVLIVLAVSIFFGIILQVPKKYLVHIGIIGAAGRAVFLLIAMINSSSVYATFITTLIITALAHILARLFKAPVTIFLIPGIISMIPGYYLYLSVYNFIQMDTTLSWEYLIETISISGSIAVAIFVVDSVFKFIMDLGKHRC